MIGTASHSERTRRSPGTEAERRRSRRLPTPGTFVAIEAPAVAEDICWCGTAIDVNADGMALVLPPELCPGSEVLLSLRFDEETELKRVPSTVIRQDAGFGIGAVRFGTWPEAQRHTLLSFLQQS